MDKLREGRKSMGQQTGSSLRFPLCGNLGPGFGGYLQRVCFFFLSYLTRLGAIFFLPFSPLPVWNNSHYLK